MQFLKKSKTEWATPDREWSIVRDSNGDYRLNQFGSQVALFGTLGEAKAEAALRHA